MAPEVMAGATGRDDNQAFWGQQSAPQFYAGRSELYPPEQTILRQLAPECRGRPILDIGVGAGRTTASLLEISADYLGIDYSAAMIRHCQARFPGVAFQQADARDLGQLRERHYALILFSFNGLDYIAHHERLGALKRIRALLASNGWLVFSTHNRLHRVLSPWDLRNVTSGPVRRLPGRLWGYWRGVAAYRANRSGEYEAPDHAMRVDNCFNYTLLTYYISPADQLEQLRAAGFAPAGMYGMNGAPAGVSPPPDDSWLYYTARG